MRWWLFTVSLLRLSFHRVLTCQERRLDTLARRTLTDMLSFGVGSPSVCATCFVVFALELLELEQPLPMPTTAVCLLRFWWLKFSAVSLGSLVWLLDCCNQERCKISHRVSFRANTSVLSITPLVANLCQLRDGIVDERKPSVWSRRLFILP